MKDIEIPSCGTCRFSVPANKPGLPHGLECRRLPPTHEAAKIDRWSQPKHSGWPRVPPTDWCGEWTLSSAEPKLNDAERAQLVFQLPPARKQAETREKRLLTQTETAEYLAVTERALEGWRYKGGGPPYIKMSIGKRGSIRYRIEDIETRIADRRVHHTSEKSVAEQAWSEFIEGKLQTPRPRGR